jgi:hypothetical protein
MGMTKTAALEARTKLHDLIDSRSLDMTISALLLLQMPTTVEAMTVRIELISSINRRFPQIDEWILRFYDCEDDDPCWDLDTVDVIMLARDDLRL